ncbi:hypothetical protein [Robertmurraya sp. FSL R5-0851]|uniref:hypothetical protein n=1 Tax=Robertmurraya sp. FSL R5-0851 TaxID=2921584 RepID=UPI0030F97D75
MYRRVPNSGKSGCRWSDYLWKKRIGPNLHYLDPNVTASLEDFNGSKGEGFRPFEVGCMRRDGEYWFSDCIYEPGLIEEDFKELKSLLLAIHLEYQNNYLSTHQQLIS